MGDFDGLHISLLAAVALTALIGFGVGVWLAIGRSRALADLENARENAAAERERLVADLQTSAERLESERRRAEDQAQQLQRKLDEVGARLATAGAEAARLEAEADAAEQRHVLELAKVQELAGSQLRHSEALLAAVKKSEEEVTRRAKEVFESLAAETLKGSTTEFLKLAEQRFGAQKAEAQADLEAKRRAVEELVKPLTEAVAKTKEQVERIESERVQSFATLTEQLRAAGLANESLRQETGKLVSALKKPQVRGAYGEVQLRRVVELAGMRDYCGDFNMQDSVRDSDNRLLRPDMTISLPNERTIVVDAKTNIGAYIEALEAANEADREACMERFARHVAEQVQKLAAKNYWDQFEKTPEFVVMFIPGDQFVDAALQRRPDLFELASSRRIILASPSTLIGLLRAVELGWREQKLAEQAEELRELGTQMHERAAKVWEHAAELGTAIERAVRKYNDFAASVDTRLTPTLRKFEEAGVKSAKVVPELPAITVTARMLESGVKEPLFERGADGTTRS